MAIFKAVQEHDANASVSESYAKVKARYGGRLPEPYKLMANDPTYLAHGVSPLPVRGGKQYHPVLEPSV